MHRSRETLILGSKDIQLIISKVGLDHIMEDMIDKITMAISAFDEKQVNIPARDGFNYSTPSTGLIEWMPLYKIDDIVTIKIVGYHPNNPANFNIPTILSSISQYDTHTGHLLGLVDGVLITALRTGAASAIASKYLAHPNSKVVGLIGCGAQSVTQLHAICAVYAIEEVLYYDVEGSTMMSFKERTQMINTHATFRSSSIEEIISSADIVCTATSIEVGQGPLFENIVPKEHLHINAVGSDFPGKVEVPMDIIDHSFICADFIDQALVEGECQRLTRERIDADLTSLAKNPLKYENWRQKLSVFDSTGWALEDHISMELFLKYAAELDVGQWVELESIPEDSKNPYSFLGVSVS